MCRLEEARAFTEVLSDVPYKKLNGPLSESSTDELWESGFNCQLLFHLVWEELFGWVLPRWMRSSELFADTNFLQEVSRGEERPGDLCFLGKSEWSPRKRPDCEVAQQLHLATVIRGGENPLLIHMAWKKGERGGVKIESLADIQSNSRYQQLFAVKRRR